MYIIGFEYRGSVRYTVCLNFLTDELHYYKD